jgi:small subunit ribosomal protein S11
MTPTKTTQKQKAKRVVENGKFYITATFNNTLVTVTDEQGVPIVISSCGMYGFTGTRKSTPYAGTVTTEAAIKKATEDHNMRKADIFVKGIGPGREASLRALRASSIDVGKIVDMTPIPHNGVRPPKVRRV